MKSMVNLLPKTQIRLLQAAVVVLSAIWVSMGATVLIFGGLIRWDERSDFVLIVMCLSLGTILITVGVSLWRLRPMARAVTKFMIGFLIVMQIVSTVGPCLSTSCSYGDLLTAGLVMYLLFSLLGFCLFGILDRYQGEFIGSSGNQK